MFLSIDHPAIACHDVQKQVEWYCAHLGMRVIVSSDDSSAALIGYDDLSGGGAVIEMMPAREAGPNSADVPRFSPGLRHLALRVSDFEKSLHLLKAAGVQFLGEPGTAMGGGRIVSFRDPEGNELQIVERPAINP